MSETAGASNGAQRATRTVTEQTAAAFEPAHESYSFVCMRCGSGWEQSYEIRHHVDAKGLPFVTYYADGKRVPSPLTRPTCVNCGSHTVRIMRSGQVSVVADALHLAERTAVPATLQSAAGPLHDGGTHGTHERREGHHWHLSDLLRPFHRK
ncbi:hypothetical protein [Streptomyces hesseae]|uniref:C2H2-type domain-containing protein n=1 Tax=Streptomyces hesseae TaxID=3075519 RepID=A0ABU2SK02_9ACTN|nr:hypothetical protein [Streptomyces sp. DSM 40473]MDT0448714.1 hypothetical protein [Streptomyces sp. DSM 40473]